MITVKIDITTKKGVTIQTTWGLWQGKPYPSFNHRLDWENTGGLFKEYYEDKAKGLGREYHFALLRNDRTEWTGKDRTDYAGFVPYLEETPNPGSFAYRGNDMGEITGSFDINPAPFSLSGCVDWSVRGWSGTATPSERDFLNNAVKPALIAAAEAHKDALKAEAIEALRAHVAENLADARASLDKAEKVMAAAIDAL